MPSSCTGAYYPGGSSGFPTLQNSWLTYKCLMEKWRTRVHFWGRGQEQMVGGARLGKGRREKSLSVSRLSPSPQPLAGGLPALKHLSQGWLLPPCPSSETPEGGPYLGCGAKPGTSGVSPSKKFAETSLLCLGVLRASRSHLSPHLECPLPLQTHHGHHSSCGRLTLKISVEGASSNHTMETCPLQEINRCLFPSEHLSLSGSILFVYLFVI